MCKLCCGDVLGTLVLAQKGLGRDGILCGTKLCIELLHSVGLGLALTLYCAESGIEIGERGILRAFVRSGADSLGSRLERGVCLGDQNLLLLVGEQRVGAYRRLLLFGSVDHTLYVKFLLNIKYRLLGYCIECLGRGRLCDLLLCRVLDGTYAFDNCGELARIYLSCLCLYTCLGRLAIELCSCIRNRLVRVALACKYILARVGCDLLELILLGCAEVLVVILCYDLVALSKKIVHFLRLAHDRVASLYESIKLVGRETVDLVAELFVKLVAKITASDRACRLLLCDLLGKIGKLTRRENYICILLCGIVESE